MFHQRISSVRALAKIPGINPSDPVPIGFEAPGRQFGSSPYHLLVSGPQQNDLEYIVVVPSTAGPVRRLSDVDKPRDDVDWLVDDMFGQVDEEGPSATDAVLLTGGIGAIVASQLLALPGLILGAGVAAAGIGVILPARSALRKMKQARRRNKIASVVGDGRLLNTDNDLIASLVTTHDDVLERAKAFGAAKALRISNVAHGLLDEVASLLDGRRMSDAETGYVSARVAAIQELDLLVKNVKHDAEPRRAQVAARLAIEASTTSALTEAHELNDDLLTQREQPDEL